MTLFFFVSSFVSILVPPSSSFYFAKALCLFFSCYISLSTSSLLTPALIINLLVDLLKFYILGAIRKEWKKRKCKGWNGKKGPTFILSGWTKLFIEKVALFSKHNIGSWIPIQTMHLRCCKNMALVHWCHFLILFCWILLRWIDITCHWMQGHVSSINSTTIKFTINVATLELTPRYSRSIIWPIFLDSTISGNSHSGLNSKKNLFISNFEFWFCDTNFQLVIGF
jgi:hypothetical protein